MVTTLRGQSTPPLRAAAVARRQSVDSEFTNRTAFGPVMVPPRSAELDWSLLTLDANTLSRITPARAVELLTDLSPDMSRAAWDYLRLSNPGVEITARRPGSDQPDPAGQAWVERFWYETLAELYGAPEVLVARINMGVFLRGAVFIEGVLDAAGRELVDIATPDPQSARFVLEQDPVRGEVWRLGQQQGWKFVRLDRPTVRYIPIDPFPGSPYGRSMAAPGLFPALFGMGLLHDLRRVVAQQGYPRLDLTVLVDKLRASFPAAAANPAGWQDWVQGLVKDVADMYGTVGPDEAYVHTDSIVVGRPVGALDSSSLSAVDGLTGMLDRLAVRALKTMPLLFGITDGVSEANANRQWEIHAAGVKAGQHMTENALGSVLSIGAQAQGLPVIVEVRFAELRAAEEFRDAQTLALRIDNWVRMGDELRIATTEEISEDLLGHAPPDEADLPPLPAAPPAAPPATASGEPDPGSNRQVEDRGVEFDEELTRDPLQVIFEEAVRAASESRGLDADAVLAILHREIPPPTPLPVAEPAGRTNGAAHG